MEFITDSLMETAIDVDSSYPPELWTHEQLQEWFKTWIWQNNSPIIIIEAINRMTSNGMEFSKLSRDWLYGWLGTYGVQLHDDFHRMMSSFNVRPEATNDWLWKPEDDVFSDFVTTNLSPEIDALIVTELDNPTFEDMDGIISDLEKTCFDDFQFEFKMSDNKETQTENEQGTQESVSKKTRNVGKTFLKFMKDLLADEKYSPTIRWMKKEENLFEIPDIRKLDELWYEAKPGVKNFTTRRAFAYHLNEAKDLKTVNIYHNHYKFV